MGAQGGDPQKVLAVGDNGLLWHIQWSPGGGRIAYSETRQMPDGVEVTIGTSDLKGRSTHPAVSNALSSTRTLFSNFPGCRVAA